MSTNQQGGEGGPQWLGLLKWSLNYVDGTRPSDESLKPMSAEDKAFLERVMTDGIVNPGKRMKELLLQLTELLSNFCSSESSTSSDEKEEDIMMNLLEELRDIVEQIDYARDFVKMNGLPFLLGFASEDSIPSEIRKQCLRVLSTLAQNNPPVQQALLDCGALDQLCELYGQVTKKDENGTFRTLLVQALSCMIRGYELGEESFCNNVSCRALINHAISVTEEPINLKRKILFLLRALVTSDYSSYRRIQDFDAAIQGTVNFLEIEDWELRVATLSLLLQILQQRHRVNGVMSQKGRIVFVLAPRVETLRASDDETSLEEMELCEALIIELAKDPSDINVDATSAPLMILAENQTSNLI